MNAALNDPEFFDASQGLLDNDVKLADGEKGAGANKIPPQKISLKQLENIYKNIQGERAAGGSAFNSNLLDYLELLAANVPGDLGQQFLALHERAENLVKVNVPGDHGFGEIEKRAIDHELQLGMMELRKYLDEQLSKQKRA
ncbi:MAG: hypothetical protein IT567_03695 [Alphaproteobacteria bacterium]|nr:hypothetical protein [Alphaproteobacteria bacterium]